MRNYVKRLSHSAMACATVVAAPEALAQSDPPAEPPQRLKPGSTGVFERPDFARARNQSAEKVSEDPILFEADTVTRVSEDSPILAVGDVKAYFGERYLRADRLSFDPATDIVIAAGNVSITDENLETVFADSVQLSGDLRDGVAQNFSALLAESARLASESAVQEQGARTRLRKAVYTACNVCKPDGTPKDTPTWRIKSLRVVRDAERKVVRFHHSFFEIKGVPLFYSPFMQGPDPSVERQSGFLTPRIGASSRLGFNAELPYYFAISNSQDATLAPRYTGNDGVLWQAEYRRRDDNAYNVVSGAVIDFDNEDDEPDAPELRWHVFAKGHRDFGDRLRLGYDVERVSDDTYLRRYQIRRRSDLRKEVDTSQTNQLRSTSYAAYDDGEHRIRAESFTFQDLRAPNNQGISSSSPEFLTPEGRDDLTPYVLPMIDYEHRGWRVAGGRATVTGNFAALQRKNGLESRRLTARGAWEREHITKDGHRFKAFAELRGDVFSYDDLNEGTIASRGLAINDADAENDSDFVARFSPTVGVEWSYPLTKRFSGAQALIEPRVQLVASPADLNDDRLINEDSRSVEFDYAALFDYNKSAGYDAIEDGQRLNVGLAASVLTDDNIGIEAEIGQQFRSQTTSAFTTETATAENPFPNGIGDEKSDIVGALNIRYRNVFGIENRYRFERGFSSLARAESLAYLSFWRLRGNLSYVRLEDRNEADGLFRREEINARMGLRLTKNWQTHFGWREDLVGDRTIFQNYSLAYSDDCALFEVTYRRDGTSDRGLQRDNALLFRFTLKSLVDG
ncbi:MAG: LPS assembly protein LptD [Pseudomonadota bacterium]